MSLGSVWGALRVWTMLAALLTRGVGFVASFSLSREAGVDSLALYIALVITGAAVVAPFAQVLFNAATLEAARGVRGNWLPRFARSNLGLTAGLLWPLLLVFYVLHWRAASGLAQALGVPVEWLMVVGVSVVWAPMLQAVLTGLLNGLGAQMMCARLTAGTAGLLLPFSYPAVHWAGVRGAWVVLMVSVWLPVMVLWFMLERQWGDRSPVIAVGAAVESPRLATYRHFRQGLPNAASLLLGGVVTWLCSIDLAQQYWGAHGVAVLAVNNQWLSLVLLPATSWGAVALGELAQARAGGVEAHEVKRLVRRWVLRNAGVTAAVALAVVAVSPWLQQAYRLSGDHLWQLLLVSGLAAILTSAYGVMERVLVCWGQQRYLLLVAVCGALVQVLSTYGLIRYALVGVQWAVLLGAITTLACGLMAATLTLRDAHE